ncbi:MAG: hypothetical protein ACM3UU_10445 [Ignavibacteriales bacterium]
MKESARLLKAIAFVVITFVFAFILFTGKYPLMPRKDRQENTIADNNRKQADNIVKNETKPSSTDKNANSTESADIAQMKNDINGSWQVVEISSGDRTAKIDITKKLTPEETMIYNFKDNRIDVYWGNDKSVLTYRWLSKDTIETIQPASNINQKDYKETASVSIKGDKLYMTAIDADNNKTIGILVRYKGSLPKVISKSKN